MKPTAKDLALLKKLSERPSNDITLHEGEALKRVVKWLKKEDKINAKDK
jgi:hypothetical protein